MLCLTSLQWLPKSKGVLGSLLLCALLLAGCNDPLNLTGAGSTVPGTVKPVTPDKKTDLTVPEPPVASIATQIEQYWKQHTDVPPQNMVDYYGAFWAMADVLAHDGTLTGDDVYFKNVRDVRLFHKLLLQRLEMPTNSPFAQQLQAVFNTISNTESDKLAENGLRQKLVDAYRSVAVGCAKAAISRGVLQQPY